MEKERRILVVSPDDDTRYLLKCGLRKLSEDYVVVVINERDEAVQKVQEMSFNLIILDVAILNQDMIAFTKLLQSLSPESKVIWITSCDSLTYRLQAHEMSIYHSLLKPFKLSDVRCIVQRAVEANKLGNHTLPYV